MRATIEEIEQPYVLVQKYVEMTGDTEKAIERRRERGVWLDGHEYHKGPDGRIRIDIAGVNRWSRGERKQG